MKKIIAIILAAAMIMPTAAFGSTVDAGEEGTYEEGIDAESIEEAVDNFFSSLEGLIDEWSSAFRDSEDAEYEAEDEESGQRDEAEEREQRDEAEESEHRGEREENEQYQAYDVIINGVLDDIRDTVDRIMEDFEPVSEDIDEYLSDWFEDCMTEIEDLIDRAKASYRDFLRLAVPDADGDDEALEDALEYYNQSILDGIVEIIWDEVLANVLDTAIDSLAGIIEDWDIEDWNIEDWGIDDWEDWSIDDWGIDDWDIDDWDVDDEDIDLWNAWTDYLDWIDELLNGDLNLFDEEEPTYNL